MDPDGLSRSEPVGWYGRLIRSYQEWAEKTFRGLIGPIVPTVICFVFGGILPALGFGWIVLILGILLLALLPLWDSCVMGLLDALACLVMIAIGVLDLVMIVLDP